MPTGALCGGAIPALVLCSSVPPLLRLAAEHAPQQSEVDKKRARRQDWVDVDAMNHEDPQAVSHYAMSIFEHLKDSEVSGDRQAQAVWRPLHSIAHF